MSTHPTLAVFVPDGRGEGPRTCRPGRLVNRLAPEYPEKRIDFLSPMVRMCATMNRIDLPHLAWGLENLARDTPVNRIQVAPATAGWARLAF
jgi:quinolinate synthase